MTDKEKAQAYDEALNWMRTIYPSLSGADKEDAEHFFPDLRESEDERIRKHLVDMVKRETGFTGFPSQGQVLAYLEKQKERGPLTKDEEYELHRIIEFLKDETCPSEWISLLHDIYCLPYEKHEETSKAIEAVDRIDKYIDEHLANAHDMKDSNPDKKYYRGWDDALGKMAGILQDVYSGEKQKESLRDFIDNFPYSDEQKESENTSASTMIPSCHEELTEFELVLFNAVLDNNFVGAKGSENALAMTKKVAPELLAIAKKEPDWDRGKCFVCQEYEKGFKQGHLEGCTAGYNKAMKEVEQKEQKPVVTHGETYHVDTLGTQQVIAGKMPQKPAEWSEADEEKLKAICTYLRDYSRLVKLGDKLRFNEYCDFLESLRPSWKPSEEQMNALKDVIETVPMTCRQQVPLESLYSDLNKNL